MSLDSDINHNRPFDERLTSATGVSDTQKQPPYECIIEGVVNQAFPGLSPGAVANYAVNGNPEAKQAVMEYISRQPLFFRLVTRAQIIALRRRQ